MPTVEDWLPVADPLGALELLREHSWLRATTDALGDLRFAPYEVGRVYLRSKLQSMGQARDARQAHAERVVEQAEELVEAIERRGDRDARRRLRLELANLEEAWVAHDDPIWKARAGLLLAVARPTGHEDLRHWFSRTPLETRDRLTVQVSLQRAAWAAGAGEGQQARDAFHAALAEARTLDDPSMVASAQLRWAAFLLESGDRETAAVQLREALRTFEEAGEPAAVARACTLLSLAVRYLGGATEAERLTRRALRIRRELGDADGEASARGNLAITLAQRGQLAAAIGELEQGIARWQVAVEPALEGRGWTNLGWMHLARRDGEAAIEALDRAISLHRRTGQQRSEARARINLGIAYLLAGDLDRARAVAVEGLAAAEELEDSSRAAGLGHLGVVELVGGNASVAVGHLERAVSLFDAFADAHGGQTFRGYLAIAYAAAKRSAEATEVLGNLQPLTVLARFHACCWVAVDRIQGRRPAPSWPETGPISSDIHVVAALLERRGLFARGEATGGQT